MSTYYIPPRQHAHSEASYRSPSTLATDVECPRQTEPELQLDQSIYIFPTPSSVPPSPSGSSVLSAPSDFTEAFSLSTGTRSRDQSFSSSAPRSPRHRSRPQGAAFAPNSYRSTSHARSSGEDYDPEVEVWDWTAESGEDIPDDDGLWEFEAEVERASRWDVPVQFIRRLSPLRPMSNPADFYEQHYRLLQRTRTQSNISNFTSVSSLSSHPSVVQTPHPRMHIPLLSFFASLLSLNLDDPGLRLLTNSSPDSVLFPGQSNLLSDGASWSSTAEEETKQPSPHGLLRLQLSEDGSRPPNTVLKDGLAVSCDPDNVPNPFTLPGLSTLAGLYCIVGGVWSSGEKAWREVQDAGSSPTS
ncbi:hypothetical protein EIP86_009664 [Pleurotus ostreatoroseus]|nr:hypothetical protein EIP86_009664 [Pleurotus ostreatoroseus]